MGLSAKVGTFALNTAIGEQAVTGVGFQPKVVLFFCSENVADGVIEDQNICIGAAVSSTSRGCATTNDEDNVATTDSSRSNPIDLCLRLLSPGSGSTSRVEADFVSLDADGFTIDITVKGDAYIVGYLALAGTDLTDVVVGSFNPDGDLGEQAITGVGFQPDAIMFLSCANDPGGSSQHEFQLSFAISSTERAFLCTTSDNGEPTSDTSRFQETDSCYGNKYTLASFDGKADFVSFGADGFTIDWSDAGTVDDDIIYVAFQGGQYAIGDLTTQTGTGEFSETGVGFEPSAGIFASFCNAASAVAVEGLEISLGIATSSSDRFVVGGVAEDGQGTTDTDQFQDDGLMYKNYDFNQGVEGAIDFVSWGADGFTLDQTDADPSANQMIYFMIGADAVVGGNAMPMAMDTYRRRRIAA